MKTLKGLVIFFVIGIATISFDSGSILSSRAGSENINTFTDSRDGNTYAYKTIGMQTWMIQNLAYLPSISHPLDGSGNDPHYYVYDSRFDDVATAKIKGFYEAYGVLYNWTAAKTACPAGWHLPTDTEWKILEIKMGLSPSDADKTAGRFSGDIAYKLKSKIGWLLNGNGDNNSGFTVLPSGSRSNPGFCCLLSHATFWSDSPCQSSAWGRELYFDLPIVQRGGYNTSWGFSVRCVKD